MIQLLLNKTTPHFQLLPMSKVDQSYYDYAFMRSRLYSNQKVILYKLITDVKDWYLMVTDVSDKADKFVRCFQKKKR